MDASPDLSPYRAKHVEREHVEELKIVGEDVRERHVEGERGRANDLERHVKGLEVSAVEDGATELSKPALVESVEERTPSLPPKIHQATRCRNSCAGADVGDEEVLHVSRVLIA